MGTASRFQDSAIEKIGICTASSINKGFWSGYDGNCYSAVVGHSGSQANLLA